MEEVGKILDLIVECFSDEFLDAIKLSKDPLLEPIRGTLILFASKLQALDSGLNNKAIIEHLKKAEESAILLKQMSQAIDEVFWMFDGAKQKVLYVSPGYEKIWGLTCQSLYENPKSFIEAIHKDDRERVLRALSKQTTAPYREIYRVVQPSGNIRWIEDRSLPSIVKSGGEVRIAGIARDITLQKETEEELKRQEARLRAIIDASPVPMALNDEALNITFLNPAFVRTYGYTQRDIPTVDIWWPKAYPDPVYQEEIKVAWVAELDRVKRTGTPFAPMNLTVVCKNGEKKDVQVSASSISPGFTGDHLVMLYDLTDFKRAERERDAMKVSMLQAAKLASLGQIAAGVAHEINNPIAIIAGAASQLEKLKDEPKKLSDRIDAILKSVARISRIVGGLKKFSRSSDGPVFKYCSISAIVSDAIALTIPMSRASDTIIRTKLSSDAMIYCDEVAIEQVVINLVGNAIDAVKDQNEKWVEVESLEDEDSILLRVSDSGAGVPTEIRDRIYDPFFTTKPVGQGTGLGLSISKGILDEHNAMFTLLKDAKNTCFEIRFPKESKTRAN